MLEAHALSHLHAGDAHLSVVASFEERQKSRYRTHTEDGQALGWFLPRGYVLREGDVLLCTNGAKVLVRCADEAVSEVRAKDSLGLLRAAYHLGNRHVALQVSEHFLRYQQDHVLDAMIEGLGLKVQHCAAPFQPESGAYSQGHAHSHAHDDGHSHSHSHDH